MPRQVLSRKSIVAAGMQLLAAGKADSFAAVARQLGTRSQALYAYFANQTVLNYAILAQIVNQLVSQVQAEVFGYSGRTGIIKLAETCRRIGLAQIKLSLFAIALPRTDAYPDVTAAYARFAAMLRQMVASAYPDERQQLLIARNVRDLIIGDVVNVGAGWFSDPGLDADSSFTENLRRSLP